MFNSLCQTHPLTVVVGSSVVVVGSAVVVVGRVVVVVRIWTVFEFRDHLFSSTSLFESLRQAHPLTVVVGETLDIGWFSRPSHSLR